MKYPAIEIQEDAIVVDGLRHVPETPPAPTHYAVGQSVYVVGNSTKTGHITALLGDSWVIVKMHCHETNHFRAFVCKYSDRTISGVDPIKVQNWVKEN